MEIKQLSYPFLLPSPREMVILEYLWSHKAASSSDIYGVFGQLWQVRRQVVHGMLQVMLEKGFIERRIEQSGAIYQAASSRADFEQAVIQQLAETFFHGSLYALWRSLIRHPQFRLALEQTSESVTLDTVRQPN